MHECKGDIIHLFQFGKRKGVMGTTMGLVKATLAIETYLTSK